MAASIHRGYPDIPAWIPYAVLAALAVALLLALSRTTVAVRGADGAEPTSDDAELHVGQAHIPVHLIGEVEVIGGDHKRKAFGPELDPAAFVVHRAWIGTALRIELTDPDDPTPFWLFSTRKPERLARALGVPQ